jgi:hypothetical protein
MSENTFQTLNVRPDTKRRILILAPILGDKIFELVASWTDEEWKRARAAGLVSDRMLADHTNESRESIK